MSETCQRLKGAPSDETLRKVLWATLPPQCELEARLNRGLGEHLPKAFFRRGQRLAVDFTLIPYHGQALEDEAEIRRGQPKSGTTHFHAYATAYVVQHGQRYTVAMTSIFKDESTKAVLHRLLDCHPNTIRQGQEDVSQLPEDPAKGRVRKKGVDAKPSQS